ncbi:MULTISPECIES: ABC transporter permease [Paracoccus]|jgi:peptide/nickel transport system permease protein|uniref:ABC transporter permease subunit n=1 Tax=Paracoccus litorisediminis TaxID=2006130 RepID=A0A844HQ84_9RHOB|nr:ABC transporter permease [Paracoccus sp. PAR01]MTH62050.1 ABC transporter permease subunit [Paracoccus litorisediminis]
MQNNSQGAPAVSRRRRSLSIASASLAARIGMIVVLIYLLVALFAPFLAPFGEAQVASSIPYAPPDGTFLLGTDQLGRDQFSRLIYGARNSMGIALATTLISFTVGGLVGVISAVLGGWVDQLISRLVDVIMAIPQLIFALILLSIAGSSIPNLILIIALLDSTRVFRVSRSVAMNVAAMEFIEAAHLRGERLPWIIRREVLPNIMPTLVAEFGLRFCFAFLTISALSFLGLGIQPPTADWGSMVREASALIAYGNLTLFIPAGAIAVLTISVNLIVDWFLDKASGLRNGQ